MSNPRAINVRSFQVFGDDFPEDKMMNYAIAAILIAALLGMIYWEGRKFSRDIDLIFGEDEDSM